jgi:hypothetical protein
MTKEIVDIFSDTAITIACIWGLVRVLQSWIGYNAAKYIRK